MPNSEVQKLVGRRVRVQLGADGAYVGELLALTGSPWQGRVRITGVITPAQHLVPGSVARRGHRPGEFVETGHAALAPTEETGHSTYLAAIQAELNKHLGSHSGYQTSPDAWSNEAQGRALRAAHVAEERRVATGQWRLIAAEGECLV